MTTRMSRRGFLTGARPTPQRLPQADTGSRAAPAQSFLEEFYTRRANDPCPPLVYEQTCLAWDSPHDAQAKPKDV